MVTLSELKKRVEALENFVGDDKAETRNRFNADEEKTSAIDSRIDLNFVYHDDTLKGLSEEVIPALVDMIINQPSGSWDEERVKKIEKNVKSVTDKADGNYKTLTQLVSKVDNTVNNLEILLKKIVDAGNRINQTELSIRDNTERINYLIGKINDLDDRVSKLERK